MSQIQETHVYAVVRVAVQRTDFDEPELVAKDIADAVAKSPNQWMEPKLGMLDVEGAGIYKISAVEFSDEINWTTVIDRNRDTEEVIREHHFDVTGEPMIGRPGFLTAREARLDAEVEQLRNQLAALTATRTGNSLSKAPSGGDVMHKSVSLENLAEIVEALLCNPRAVGELDDSQTYQSFIGAVAQAVCDHCGGEIYEMPNEKNNWHIGIRGNDSLPENSEGVWRHKNIIPF